MIHLHRLPLVAIFIIAGFFIQIVQMSVAEAQSVSHRYTESFDPRVGRLGEHQPTLSLTNNGRELVRCKVIWRFHSYRQNRWMDSNSITLAIYPGRTERSILSGATRGTADWNYSCY